MDEEDSVSFPKDRSLSDVLQKKKKQGVPFNGKATRFNYKSKEKRPDPGTYETGNNCWNKRTYNILFAEI